MSHAHRSRIRRYIAHRNMIGVDWYQDLWFSDGIRRAGPQRRLPRWRKKEAQRQVRKEIREMINMILARSQSSGRQFFRGIPIVAVESL